MINRRATLTAIAGFGVAGLASGCLSSSPSENANSDGSAASGAGKSTISVMYGLGPDSEPGFKADLAKFAEANGITIEFIKAASWDTEIRTKVQGGNPPDVGLFPQPGLMCDLAKQRKLIPYDAATVALNKRDARPGRHRGRHLCRRPGLRPAHRAERQERPVDRRAGVQGGRLHRPEDARRAAHPHREDQGRRQDPVVHRRRVRRCHRLADHRLDRGPRPALRRPRELRQVGQGRAEVRQPGDQARLGVLPEDRLR